MIDELTNEITLIYQESSDEGGPPEEAIWLRCYSDTLQIVQREAVLNINYESLPDIVRTLRRIQKSRTGK